MPVTAGAGTRPGMVAGAEGEATASTAGVAGAGAGTAWAVAAGAGEVEAGSTVTSAVSGRWLSATRMTTAPHNAPATTNKPICSGFISPSLLQSQLTEQPPVAFPRQF